MTFAIGVYDLFACLIPGSLYVALFGYIAGRAGWIDTLELAKSPSILLVFLLVLVSYIIGQATDELGVLIEKLGRSHAARDYAAAKARFIRKDGVNANRAFLALSPAILLAAVELDNKDAAADISRLRAEGIMLRNAAVPLLLAAMVAVVEVFVGSQRLFACGSAILLILAFAGCLRRGRTLRRWANGKMLELCYWIEEIDERVLGFSADES